MSADKDGKSPAPTPAPKTVVGVPALPVPPDRPSDMEMTRELPPKGQPSADESVEPSTALDVKAVSKAEAERVLAWTGFTQEEIPTVQGSGPTPRAAAPSPSPSPKPAGALPRPAPRTGAPGKTLPPAPEMFRAPSRPPTRPLPPEKGTRPGVAPQTGISPTGRSTLLLDGSAPPAHEAPDGEASQERPPIVVPGAPTPPPNSITKPPPWGEGAARVSPRIPRGAGAPRGDQPGIEEISSSLLLPDASGEAPAQNVEELSGSVLVEDAPDGSGVPVAVRPARPTPSAPPLPRGASVKPPVPTSPSNRPGPAAHRALLGMPELPKATPAPRFDHAGTPILSPTTTPPSPSAPPAAQSAPPAAHTAPAPPPATPQPPAPTYASSVPAEAAPAAPLPPDGIPPPDPEFAAVVWPPPGSPGPVPQAAPTTPAMERAPTAPLTGDIELTQLPRGKLAPILDEVVGAWRKVRDEARVGLPRAREKLRELGAAVGVARVPGTPRWFLPAVAAAGLAVGVGLVMVLVSAVRGCGDAGRAHETAQARELGGNSAQEPSLPPAAPAATPAPTATSAAPAGGAPAGAARSLTACTVSGTAHVVAPNATVSAGVEVVVLGDDVGLGFAPSERDAMAVRVDLSSLGATATMRARSREPVRRVTPLLSPRGTLSLVVDADRKNDRLQARRTIVASPPLQIGVAAAGLAWAKVGGPPAGTLWPLDEGAPVDALRGAAAGDADRTIALAFRRGGSVWMGVAAGTPAPTTRGDLAHVEGLGTAVGSPAVAVNDGVVVVAWADRPSSDETWRLRWVRFDAGGAPAAPQTFTPPAGGRGEQAMSPAVAALSGGRFLLVWTEGPTSGHDVRALTLSSEGKPLGEPLVISNAGVNAGQGQAAVTASGRGVVAFLESNGTGFQVGATPITCQP